MDASQSACFGNPQNHQPWALLSAECRQDPSKGLSAGLQQEGDIHTQRLSLYTMGCCMRINLEGAKTPERKLWKGIAGKPDLGRCKPSKLKRPVCSFKDSQSLATLPPKPDAEVQAELCAWGHWSLSPEVLNTRYWVIIGPK